MAFYKGSTMIAGIGGGGGGGGGTKVQLSCVASEGNTVATLSVDNVPYTLKSGPVGSTVSLSDVKAGGLKVADITINGTSRSLATEALPVNSRAQAGIVAKGDGNASKVWGTDASGAPGWRTPKYGNPTLLWSGSLIGVTARLIPLSADMSNYTFLNVDYTDNAVHSDASYFNVLVPVVSFNQMAVFNDSTRYPVWSDFSNRIHLGRDASGKQLWLTAASELEVIAIYGI